MFCRHKYGKVQEDGYQYCTKCNKAIVAPCPHTFTRLGTFEGTRINRTTGSRQEYIEYHLQCTKCGDMKKETF